MVKDLLDSKTGHLLPPHGPISLISGKRFFYKHHSTDRMVHITAFVASVVEHWLE